MNQIPRKIVVLLLRGYKFVVSPLFFPACRYVPSCSEYAMEAIDRYGVVRGGALAIWRVLRCNPFAQSGPDPVVKASRPSVPVRCGRESELCSN